jgi:hypothetical protein
MLTANLTAKLAGTLTGTPDLGAASYAFNLGKAIALATGTGADQADLIWTDTRTIAASGTDDLDLAGSLTGMLGGTLTFARIRAIYVAAAVANTNNVVIGAAASNQFVGPFGASTHTAMVKPGGVFLAANRDTTGWAVTASTADLLRIANSGSGTGVTYDIAILGCSA